MKLMATIKQDKICNKCGNHFIARPNQYSCQSCISIINRTDRVRKYNREYKRKQRVEQKEHQRLLNIEHCRRSLKRLSDYRIYGRKTTKWMKDYPEIIDLKRKIILIQREFKNQNLC